MRRVFGVQGIADASRCLVEKAVAWLNRIKKGLKSQVLRLSRIACRSELRVIRHPFSLFSFQLFTIHPVISVSLWGAWLNRKGGVRTWLFGVAL